MYACKLTFEIPQNQVSTNPQFFSNPQILKPDAFENMTSLKNGVHSY